WKKEKPKRILGTYMACILLVRKLGPRTAVQIHNDIQPSVLAPSDEAVEVLDPAAGEVLPVLDEVLPEPEPHGDAERVELEGRHLLDVVLRGPRVPVLLERGVGGVLAELLDARPLVVEPAAPHARELVGRHPRLDDELRP